MPLFKCDNCDCLENTALAPHSWTQLLNKQPMLCSECEPAQNKWHGRFKKVKWNGESIINYEEQHLDSNKG